jgi:hypothetical protein
MKMRCGNEIRTAQHVARVSSIDIPRCLLLAAVFAGSLSPTHASAAQSENALQNSGVTIVLPPKVMAGHPATLAVLGVDGKLVSGVNVDVGNGQIVTTDRTGRAVFDVPARADYVVAKSSSTSAAALVDPAVAASEPNAAVLPPVVSIHDRFWICAASLRGDADSNEVKINGRLALVMAASPICLVALPPLDAKPGPAALSIEAPGVQLSAATVLVSLEFEPPKPALKPNEKGQLGLTVQGSDRKLPVVVQNETPDVLKFVRGDMQELTTSGRSPNIAAIQVQAITSGNFSFEARLAQNPDSSSGERYLRAAAALAPSEVRREISKLASRLARHQREAEKVRIELDRLAPVAGGGDFRTLLDAARAAL